MPLQYTYSIHNGCSYSFLSDSRAKIRYLLLCRLFRNIYISSDSCKYNFLQNNALAYKTFFVLYYYFFLRIANVLIHWTLGSRNCSIL